MDNKIPPAVAEFAAEERAQLLERIAELEAHCVRLGQGGAERYWEGRWRDADVEIRYPLQAAPAERRPTAVVCEDAELQGLLNLAVDISAGRCKQDDGQRFMGLLESVQGRLTRTIDAGVENELALIGDRASLQSELAALKAQLQAAPAERGVVLPERKTAADFSHYHDESWRVELAEVSNLLIDEVARLNHAPATADSDVREVKRPVCGVAGCTNLADSPWNNCMEHWR